jgi:hypothetical protein
MLDETTMRELVQFIDVAHEKWLGALIPSKVWRMKYDLEEILRNGCFKHKILRTPFETDIRTTEWWCQKCSPDEHANAKEREENYKERN